jgi:polyisoprenoid-binding protein YceI
MKRTKAALLICSSILTSLSLAQVAFAKEFDIDSSHSNVEFVARHFASRVKGRFTQFKGTLSFDADKPETSKVNALVDTSSIDTNEKKRDEHLRGDDFFSAKKHPQLTFVSKTIKPNGDKKYKVEGDLTMRGVTKPVTFDVEYLGEADDPWGNHRAGFTGTTTVNRKDYGISWNKALDKGGYVLGDDVTINLNLEAIEKKAQEAVKKESKK